VLAEAGATWSPNMAKSVCWIGAQICQCAAQGDLPGLRILAHAKVDFSVQDYDGRSGLHLAACRGDEAALHVMALLLEHTQERNPVDRWNCTPLGGARYSALKGSTEHASASQMLAEAGGLVAASGPPPKAQPRMTLNLAPSETKAETNKEEERVSLLQDASFREIASQAAMASQPTQLISESSGCLVAVMLCTAASVGDVVQMRKMLRAGASPNSCDYDGRSAQHVAAEGGHLEAVDELLHAHADPNLYDRWGYTPLASACRSQHLSIVTRLRNIKATLGIPEFELTSLLCLLTACDNTDALNMWLTAGADPNLSDYDQRTALHIATSEGHTNSAALLLKFGADPSLQDRWGNTALSQSIMDVDVRISRAGC